jgi:hypothetical protein
MLVIGALGSVAVRDIVLPAQIGEATFIGEVVMTGAVGVPLQIGGTPSKPNNAVAASALVELALIFPYLRPLRPDTEY